MRTLAVSSGGDERKIFGQHDEARAGGGSPRRSAGRPRRGWRPPGPKPSGRRRCGRKGGRSLFFLTGGWIGAVAGRGSGGARARQRATLGSDQPPVTAYSKLNSFPPGRATPSGPDRCQPDRRMITRWWRWTEPTATDSGQVGCADPQILGFLHGVGFAAHEHLAPRARGVRGRRCAAHRYSSGCYRKCGRRRILLGKHIRKSG